MKGFIKRLLRENLITEKDNRELLKSKLGLSDRLSNLRIRPRIQDVIYKALAKSNTSPQ
jgi:hypothetical protein